MLHCTVLHCTILYWVRVPVPHRSEPVVYSIGEYSTVQYITVFILLPAPCAGVQTQCTKWERGRGTGACGRRDGLRRYCCTVSTLCLTAFLQSYSTTVLLYSMYSTLRTVSSATTVLYCTVPDWLVQYCSQVYSTVLLAVLEPQTCPLFVFVRRCKSWAARGEWKKNPRYMLQACPRSCDSC